MKNFADDEDEQVEDENHHFRYYSVASDIPYPPADSVGSRTTSDSSYERGTAGSIQGGSPYPVIPNTLLSTYFTTPTVIGPDHLGAHPVIVFMLSLVYPGLGHLFFQKRKAKAIMYNYIVMWVAIILMCFCLFGFVFALLMPVYVFMVALDGYQLALLLKIVEIIDEGDCMNRIAAFGVESLSPIAVVMAE